MTAVSDILRGIAQVGGAGFGGFAKDQQIDAARVLANRKADLDAKNAAVLNAVRMAGIDPEIQGKLAGAKASAEVAPAVEKAKALAPIDVLKARDTVAATAPIEAQKAVDIAKGTAPIAEATHAANRAFDNANPTPVQQSFKDVVTTAPGGDQHVSVLNTKTGELKDTGANAKAASAGKSIPAGIRSKVAENESTLATITEALSSVDQHPDAIGLSRNIPLVGKYVDQRIDPAGNATRALIANVGSLQIHTRTGANMNIREEPRLAPFVPDISDTPEAVKTKLTQLAKFLKIENDALVGGTAPAPTASAAPAAASRAQQLWDAAVAKYGEAKVVQDYGPRPPGDD